METKEYILSYSALQIFIACLVPNLGSWIIFFVLRNKFQEREDEQKVKSFLEPPGWVRDMTFSCFCVLTKFFIIFQGRSGGLDNSLHIDGLCELACLEVRRWLCQDPSHYLLHQTAAKLALATNCFRYWILAWCYYRHSFSTNLRSSNWFSILSSRSPRRCFICSILFVSLLCFCIMHAYLCHKSSIKIEVKTFCFNKI